MAPGPPSKAVMHVLNTAEFKLRTSYYRYLLSLCMVCQKVEGLLIMLAVVLT